MKKNKFLLVTLLILLIILLQPQVREFLVQFFTDSDIRNQLNIGHSPE